MKHFSKGFGIFLVTMLLLTACGMEKESGFNRTMQNLTAHYNILFNANDLLRQKQDIYQTSYVDRFDGLLSVYQDTIPHAAAAVDKELDAAITKANTIISTKDQSHYLGDAYLVLGKANLLYGHYFNAVEFCRYVTLSFPKQRELVQEARIWEVRALMYSNQLKDAKSVLDSAFKYLNPKKSITTDVYAAAMQYHINMGQYRDAETMAKLSVQHANTKSQRLRWTFILAQLQELNNEPKNAYLNYSGVVKSNASFEMAFNADLNRIRLEDQEANRHVTRMDRLIRLLRDENNKDFVDQVYYQIALQYLLNNDIDNAIKNLQLSVRYSTKNQNQKGLSYLKLADINFKNKADYVKAKKYYDSTLTNLSPNYPGYNLIQKKNNNLQVLANRLQIIGHEDTLQTLVKLDTADRSARIEEMVANHLKQMQAAVVVATSVDPFNNAYSNSIGQGAPIGGVSNFYFDNAQAVSQGVADFKRVWGNRKLEDNWRRSKKSGSDLGNVANGAPLNANDANTAAVADQKNTDKIEANLFRQSLLQNLPLTPAKIDASNLRVYNAYVDIAAFYRDILDDKKEAINTYELLLSRYPNDPNKASIYYNLYRLYSDINTPTKADEYKNLLLSAYPNSVYARVILDPDYSRKIDDKDAQLSVQYDSVYAVYSRHQYKNVITKTDSLLRAYPDNKFAAQLLYLRSIANGHQEKLDPFREELMAIVSKYPNDRLVTPLVNQHLVYVDANKAKLAAREFVLMDNDPNEEPFIPATVPQQVMVNRPAQSQPVQRQPVQVSQTKLAATPINAPPVTQPVVTNNKPVVSAPTNVAANPPTNAVTNSAATATNPTATPPLPVVPSIYSLRDSANYYFVVNVSSGTSNLASSRFGIGQFDRVSYAGSSISHQLKDAGNDNQLIYVGRFNSLNAVKEYARKIIPLMPDIMKVPKDKYMFFIITKENLDKLADKKTLDGYIDFYQKNY